MSISYYNPIMTKIAAKNAVEAGVLNLLAGNEKQLYNIGQQIITTTLSTITLEKEDNAVIRNVYCENGYFYYDIRYDVNKAKKGNCILRQKDIKPLRNPKKYKKYSLTAIKKFIEKYPENI